ncbi:4'-phosphopantetheinyl transferase superfamily protein [uncultured Kordia sp.]|uniref:4'-phosphopantetheinyl transferase family protein n=1 Tax=uncultured Kordia sp. TaxID=507699 RepID=UPI0026226667|nr:4'-phosphopantetheinyl transferase superfamily protein [uncultured Kordia sp.]
MITIYYYQISQNAHAGLIQKYLSNFPVEFQERIQRFRRWEDAQLSLSGRLLLQYALQKHAKLAHFDWNSLSYTSYGKPYLDTSELHFNISHSGTIVACALTTGIKIGIDMEQMRPIDVEDFKRQMTNNEWQYVNTAENQLQAFYEYWTKKEAVIKADGKGMSIPLLSFEIQNNTTLVHSEKFYTKRIALSENYMCHIACNKEIDATDINLIEIPDLTAKI